MNIIPITGYGQIKEGDMLLVRRSNEFIAPVIAKQVLQAGTPEEEIVLSKTKNIYFIMLKFLDGSSWIKECRKVESGKIYSISNSMYDFRSNHD